MTTTADRADPRQDDGWTILEVIIVVIVLGVLSGAILLAVRRMGASAQSDACTADRATVVKALESWSALHPGATDVTEADLVDARFLESESVLHDVVDVTTVVAVGKCVGDVSSAATASPTSGAPSSAAPTTVVATTAAPTTAAATTPPPTTSPPTTTPPTTTPPTTIPQPQAWNVIAGTPSITADAVAISGAASMTNLQRLGTDGTVSVSASFSRGNGYGIWLRTTLIGGAVNSGYTFQWDYGYARSFVLRLWGPERFTSYLECSTPVAVVPIPASMQNSAPHEVSVTLSGQTLTASVDGTVVMTVPNLTAAGKQACPNKPVPSGDLVGYRTWSYDTVVTFANLRFA